MTCVMQLRLDRFRERLAVMKEKGVSQRQISIFAGGTPDLVRHLLAERQQDTKGDKLLRLAAALECSVAYLYGTSDDVGAPPDVEPYEPGRAMQAHAARREREKRNAEAHGMDVERFPVLRTGALPVRHIVQAGAWIEVDEAAQHRIPSPPVSADPAFPKDLQWLELVRGDSADLHYPEGMFIHVVDAVGIGYAPRNEDFVVVERRRQQGGLIERSLKQVEKRGRKVELWPRSRNPKWQQPLDLGADADGETEAEIAALVLGGYMPARR